MSYLFHRREEGENHITTNNQSNGSRGERLDGPPSFLSQALGGDSGLG